MMTRANLVNDLRCTATNIHSMAAMYAEFNRNEQDRLLAKKAPLVKVIILINKGDSLDSVIEFIQNERVYARNGAREGWNLAYDRVSFARAGGLV